MKDIVSVLTIAGSDSIGGAGIQADLKTMLSLKVNATSAITAITAQNTMGIRGIEPIEPKMLALQIDSVLEDIDIKTIKTGMLYSNDHIKVIVKSLKSHNYQGALVVDPVMVATSGDSLYNSLDLMFKELFPISTIVTPNIPEAEKISSMNIHNKEEMILAAKKIINFYNPKYVLIKAGHLNNNMTDILVCKKDNKNNEQQSDIEDVDFFIKKVSYGEKIETKNTHGTGCTLSSAIASFIALGYGVVKSVNLAKEYISLAIEGAKDLNFGKGHGSTNHFYAGKEMLKRISNNF